MNKVRYLLIISLICSFGYVFSQQVTLDNQYIVNKYAISPVYAGFNQDLEVFATYRKDWVGFEDSPQKVMLNMNTMPYKGMGVGMSINNEKMNIFSNQSFLLSYAYQVKITTEHTVRFGLSAGIFDTQIDLSDNNLQNQVDPVVMENAVQRGMAFDLGVGVLYDYKFFNIGLYVPRVLESKVKNESDKGEVIYSLKRHFILHTTYSYYINSDYEFEPSLIVIEAINSPVFVNFSGKVTYKDMFWAGLIYRKLTTFGLNVGGNYKQMVFNYSFELFGQEIFKGSSGSHEVSIGYIIGKKKKEGNAVRNPYMGW